MQKTTWRLQKEQASREEIKNLVLLGIGFIMFLITARFNN